MGGVVCPRQSRLLLVTLCFKQILLLCAIAFEQKPEQIVVEMSESSLEMQSFSSHGCSELLE